MEESNKFCTALNYGYKCQRASLCRVNGKRNFSDYKCCNTGVQACRAARGVRDSSYHRDNMPVEQWDNIVEMIKRTENALSSFVDTKSLRQLNTAKNGKVQDNDHIFMPSSSKQNIWRPCIWHQRPVVLPHRP